MKHPPALGMLYDFLVRTWYVSPNTLSREQFNIIVAGAHENYHDLGLVYRVAAVGLKYSYTDSSRRLVDFGLANAPDPDTKAKFEKLAEKLPPADKPES